MSTDGCRVSSGDRVGQSRQQRNPVALSSKVQAKGTTSSLLSKAVSHGSQARNAELHENTCRCLMRRASSLAALTAEWKVNWSYYPAGSESPQTALSRAQRRGHITRYFFPRHGGYLSLAGVFFSYSKSRKFFGKIPRSTFLLSIKQGTVRWLSVHRKVISEYCFVFF